MRNSKKSSQKNIYQNGKSSDSRRIRKYLEIQANKLVKDKNIWVSFMERKYSSSPSSTPFYNKAERDKDPSMIIISSR